MALLVGLEPTRQALTEPHDTDFITVEYYGGRGRTRTLRAEASGLQPDPLPVTVYSPIKEIKLSKITRTKKDRQILIFLAILLSSLKFLFVPKQKSNHLVIALYIPYYLLHYKSVLIWVVSW